MPLKKYNFSTATVYYYFAHSISHLKEIVDPRNTILITDQNVHAAHTKRFKHWQTIVIKAGELAKNQHTVDIIIEQLIAKGADRKTTLVGVGGGVVTDITGLVASVYMRGIAFGFVPTTILAMVDASIGGKNGVDVGLFKNMVGTIRQPHFILYDMTFTNTLPQAQWQGGFAEIIKHACIKDAPMFKTLEKNTLKQYQKSKTWLCQLVQQNAQLKTKIVQQDEFENGVRKLLNFGHTLGHAIENMHALSHGEAVAIGIGYACQFSEMLTGFKHTQRVTNLLHKYGLPTSIPFDDSKAFEILQKDKKKELKQINYILLSSIGKAIIQPIALTQLKNMLAVVNTENERKK